jgi:hypothetical protein
MPYKNPEKQAAASKRHYEANKEKVKLRSKKRNRKQLSINKKYVDKVKSESGCVDCGETNHIVLDFDHVNGNKYKSVSAMVHEYYSVNAIQKEIDKCEVRCANCHRQVTHERRKKNKS